MLGKCYACNEAVDADTLTWTGDQWLCEECLDRKVEAQHEDAMQRWAERYDELQRCS